MTGPTMTPQDHSDETLMAFADGELGPAEAAALAAAAATDPALARRIEMFRQTRSRIAALRGMTAPVAADDPLAARIRALAAAPPPATSAPGPSAPETVVPFAPRRRAAPIWGLPLAASVALLAGLVLGTALPRGGAPAADALALLPHPGLGAALDSAASGATLPLEDGASLTLVTSFDTADGAFCREIEVRASTGATTAAIACRGETGWHTHLAVIADGGAEGYVPASSLEVLDAWIATSGASAPLSPEEEAARLTPGG